MPAVPTFRALGAKNRAGRLWPARWKPGATAVRRTDTGPESPGRFKVTA